MKIALYPGSFNPFHAGHADVVSKALKIFDKVIIARGINPEKFKGEPPTEEYARSQPSQEDLELGYPHWKPKEQVEFFRFSTLLPKFVELLEEKEGIKITAVVRGLRNGYDLQHEMVQQYWYEDLGLLIPVIMIVTDRELAHISSSTLRAIKTFRAVG